MGDMRVLDSGEEGNDVELIVDATSKRVFTESAGSYTAPADSTLKLDKFTDTAKFYDPNVARDYFRLTNTVTGDVYIFHDLGQVSHFLRM